MSTETCTVTATATVAFEAGDSSARGVESLSVKENFEMIAESADVDASDVRNGGESETFALLYSSVNPQYLPREMQPSDIFLCRPVRVCMLYGACCIAAGYRNPHTLPTVVVGGC